MRHLQFGLVVLVAGWLSATAVAQGLRVERLTQDDGLSQNFINAVAQDSFGFVWIGTQDGLNRYDGYDVRAFRPDGSATSLQDGHVRDVKAGRDGSVWVATREGGLSRWDAASETFRTWRNDPKRADSLAFDYVTSIVTNDDGTLWLGTLEGLDLFDPKTNVFRHHQKELASKEVGSLFRDSSGRLWIGLRDGALDSRDARGAFTHHTNVPGEVQAMADAGHGRVWMGTASGQLLSWDATTQQFTVIPGFSAEQGIKALHADRHGTLWIGTGGGGLWRRFRNGALRLVRNDSSDAHSIPSDSIETFFADRTGVLWIGTQVGLARHDPASEAFRVYRNAGANGTEGPGNPYVWAIESDGANNIWIGSDGGLSFFDRAAGTWRSWTGNPADPNALASESVVAVLVDRSGAVWAGGNRGLSRYMPSTGTFESWLRGDAASAFPFGRVFDLLETRDGSILVGTSHGVAQWDPTRRSFFRLGGEGLLPTVFTMAEDRDGAIWLGTFHNGLYRLDRRTQETGFLRVDAKGTKFAPQQISSLLVDRRGRLWVGTSQGLFRRDPGNPDVRQYRIRDGLPNDGIMGLVEDARGRIWMSTNDGVARLEPERNALRVYKSRDGLPSNEFNQMAAGRTPRGEVLFGTPAGAVIFNPDDLIVDAQPPQVAITGFEVFNVPVPIRRDVDEEGYTLARSILTTDALTLSHREKVVTFSFAALHFAEPRAARYSYRLVGWDDRWRDAPSQRRTATYTNLPAGNYVFRVRASNKDGVWSEKGASLAMRVLPPPWRTWWAYTLYVLLIAGSIALFVSSRMRALRVRQRELEELVRVRTAELAASEKRAMEANQAKSVFLANMSHELRSPLNAVLGFSQLLERSPDVRGEDRSSLDIIRRSGEHLLGLINDVLSLSKIEAGRLTLDPRPFSLKTMILGVESMMRIRAEKAALALRVAIEGELPDAVSGDEGKLRQVLVNLLGNAVKFTERGSVTLRVSWRDGRAHFEVEDTGPGIAPAEIESLFEAFVQTESGRQSKEGTGLGLVITREIVRLMDGDITVRSTLGKGSTFAFDIALPLASEAPRAEDARRVTGLAEGEKRRRILVADDMLENRLLIVRLLGAVGFDVREASNGEEAVRAWEEEGADLILMDMRMPVLDGRDATRTIREREQARRLPRTPIVALTASAFEHERDEILACGADDFLTKPFREAQLFAILEAQTGARFVRAAQQAESAPGVTRETVAKLTAEESRSLRDALDRGAIEDATTAAESIALRDPSLGRGLLADIRAFRVDHLLDLLESTAEGAET